MFSKACKKFAGDLIGGAELLSDVGQAVPDTGSTSPGNDSVELLRSRQSADSTVFSKACEKFAVDLISGAELLSGTA